MISAFKNDKIRVCTRCGKRIEIGDIVYMCYRRPFCSKIAADEYRRTKKK